HYLAARQLLERSQRQPPYNLVLLTGSLDEDRKRTNRGRIVRGEANLVIGTHALIEEKVEFANLGLVVVDEQHRFGVMQRFRLMKKPNTAEPHVLVMTATPIPRTLALTLYGDLDVSVLNELPPGRTPIVTRRVEDERAAEVWGFVRKQVAAGHQAYIVYPVIEGSKDDQPELDFAHDPEAVQESSAKTGTKGKSAGKRAGTKSRAKTESLFEKPALKSAVAMCEELRTTHLAGLRLGLLHGRLPAEEKEVVMRRFQRGELDVLVATTVIEVGVDVANATVMAIEHAERFGLAQLHQLRGRVGRGAARSYCILMTSGRVTPQAEERLDAMVRTQDGFELAELDLTLRGPGEFFGTRQAGLPDFRVANLLRDRKLLDLARQEAARFVERGEKEMSRASVEIVWAHLKAHWQRHYGLVEAG
ncbi:MAG: helicase-related protein, partial [Acidobacteriaceae bacterium]